MTETTPSSGITDSDLDGETPLASPDKLSHPSRLATDVTRGEREVTGAELTTALVEYSYSETAVHSADKAHS